MDVDKQVTDHYGSPDLAATILAAVAAGGGDTTRLAPQDLAPIDHLHAGFAAATAHVLDELEVDAGTRLLDVGCGIGGGCRMAAARGARTVGVDLTAEFIRSASILTELTGLAARATFLTTSASAIDLPDGSFDTAMMLHVGMNLPVKVAVFTEVRRLLAPGGRFAVYDQMRTGAGQLTYPLPWAVDESTSFVSTPGDYRADLETAGFRIESSRERTREQAGAPSAPAGNTLSPAVIFGPDFVTRIENNIAATEAGLLGAHLIIAVAR
ncbi:MAG: class I SAM-dependent methyltransferase [Nocardioides sp.]|nr:class I SAM-dependent methyltransferase [Nocardioides sp.]